MLMNARVGNKKKRLARGDTERDVWAAGQNGFLDLTDWENEEFLVSVQSYIDDWEIC
jgi:hypothetical protein